MGKICTEVIYPRLQIEEFEESEDDTAGNFVGLFLLTDKTRKNRLCEAAIAKDKSHWDRFSRDADQYVKKLKLPVLHKTSWENIAEKYSG